MLQECELINVQTLLEQRQHTASGTICHLYKLDGDGNGSYVASKQKDSKVCGIASKFFQERSSLI